MKTWVREKREETIPFSLPVYCPIDRILSQLKRLNELSDEELQAHIQKLNRKMDNSC